MNERKKNLPKRLLSMTLALSMCAGLSCTTAFAADEKTVHEGDSSNVYVYVNVTDTTTEHAKGDAPKFDAGKTGTELEQSKKDVGDAKTEVESAKPNATDVTQKEDDLNSAKEAVKGALEGLKDADKPSYDGPTYTPPEDTGTTEPDPVDSNNTSTVPIKTQETQNTPDTTDVKKEPVNSEFTKDVNGAVEDLNDAQVATKGEVDNAKEGLAAAQDVVKAATEALQKVIDTVKANELATDATDKINAANALIDRYEADRTKLDNDLQDKIAELNATKPSETAPIQQEGQSYADYEAAYNTWKDACTAYNDSLNGIKAQYEADAKQLVDDITAATNAAKAAIGTAQGALDGIKNSSAKTELDAANDVLDGYTDALGNYNDKVDEYNNKVNGYNQAVTGEGGYNDKVGAYNTEVGKYNDSVDAYDNKVTEYNNAVKTYQEQAEAYNGMVTDYNGRADNWNSDAIGTDSKDLTSFIQKNSSVDVEKLDKALKTIQDISVKMKGTSGETTNPVAKLTADEVKSYNDAVAAYNAAVKKYNAKNTVDYKIQEVNKYFTGQDSYKTSGSETKEWYTVGKVHIGSVFAKKPGEILNQVLTPNNLTSNDERVYDYGYTEADKNTALAGDGKSSVAGRDIYHFNVKADGSVEIVTPNNRKDNNSEQGLFQGGQSVETLKDALDVTGNGSIKFEQKFDKTGSTSADFDPYKDVNTWVLKVSYTAKDYSEENTNETLHLDGYVCVRQLSQLVELQAWEDTSAYQEMTDWWGVGVTKDDVKKAEAATLNTANGYQGVTITPVEGVDIPTLNLQTPEKFVPIDPVSVTGIIITPKADPPAPPSGGNNNGNNDNSGGNDNPPVDIPEEDPPLVDVPEEDPPLVDVPEEEPPLVDTPEEDPVLDIPEEEPPLVAPPTTVVITETKTPLVKAPTGVDIVDEAVPLADVPKTGDNTALWIAMALASAGALAVLAPRKKENG